MIAPAFFSGLESFTERTSALIDLCLASRPHPEVGAVRAPGQKALARERAAQSEGVRLADGVMPALRAAAATLGVPSPA